MTGKEGARRAAAAVTAALLALGLALVLAPAASAAPTAHSTVSCAGSTLSGNLTLSGVSAGTQVTLRLEVRDKGWSTTTATRTVAVVAGRTGYPFTFDLTGYPAAKGYRVSASLGQGNSSTSNQVDKTACAPPAQVPEVPSPMAIPLTLAVTALVVESVRRSRRRGALAGS